MSTKTLNWGGRNLSIFARSTVCNVFLAANIWYVLQVLYCTRSNIQRFHRIFATFVWNSKYERTSGTNLFRKVRDGGLGLSHLFLKQVVSRFLFLRDQQNPFIRKIIQVMLPGAIPEFVVSTMDNGPYKVSRYLCEVVSSYRFLISRFSIEYLSNVPRKRLLKDLADIVFPVPLYRTIYGEGSGRDVLKRFKKVLVPPGVKTFFFKLHTGTLPVKTWLEQRGMFVPWGVNCLLCNKPETVEHVFIDCWDAVFIGMCCREH